MLKFYTHPFSIFARRVHVALLEKNIPFEPVVVDLVAHEHKSATHLARNPLGKVPAIDDDGFTLYESAAILQYLEATRPTPALTPADPQGRALADLHLRLADQFSRHVAAVIFPKRFLPPDRWDNAAMDAARKEIEAHFAILSAQLGDHPYLVRDTFSLADIGYLPFLHFRGIMDVPVPANIEAWAGRLLSRPSATATVPGR